MMTNIGAGAFEKDQTKIRAIDRFDVKLWDEEAVVLRALKVLPMKRQQHPQQQQGKGVR